MATHVQPYPQPALVTRVVAALQRRLSRLTEGSEVRDRIRASLSLPDGERLMALECSRQGQFLAATDRALYRQAGPGMVGGVPLRWSRTGWEQMDRSSWNDRDGTLVLTGADSHGLPRTVISMPAGSTLGRFAGERVAWATVMSATVRLDGDHGLARVAVRRRPGSDGLTWQVTLAPGTPRTSEVREAVAAALARLRAQWGI